MKSLLPLFFILPIMASADVPVEQRAEVDHLLDFVSKTQCQIKRNFSYHTGKEAVAHMTKKYNYFKDDIKTTEDFIRLSATKSLLTGKAYKVQCADADLLASSTWLLSELAGFRKLNASDVKPAQPAEAVATPTP